MQCYRGIIFFCALLTSGFGFSQEHEKAANAAAEAEASGQLQKDYSGKQDLAWEKVQTQLAAIKAKLDLQESLIRKLTADKTQYTGKNSAAKIEELKKEHQELGRLTEEYTRLNLEYQTKFPERGIKESRLYKRVKSKSSEGYEEDESIQGRIDRLHTKILNQYSSTNNKLKNKNLKDPAQLPKNKVENPNKKNTEEITDQLLLKK